MEIKTLIVDDDVHAIELLEQHLSSFPFVKVLGSVQGGKSAMNFLRETSVDLIFLDIEMEDINGLELAGHIHSLYKQIHIIFVTGHAGFALPAYDYRPVDFLTKPIDYFRLEKSLHHVEEMMQRLAAVPDKKIGLKVAGGIRIVDIKDILYIEKKGRKISIIGKDGQSCFSGETMKRLEAIFEPYDFFRVHQSFIVPLTNIKSILPDTISRSHTIHLTDGTVIPVSRNRYSELQEVLQEKGVYFY